MNKSSTVQVDLRQNEQRPSHRFQRILYSSVPEGCFVCFFPNSSGQIHFAEHVLVAGVGFKLVGLWGLTWWRQRLARRTAATPPVHVDALDASNRIRSAHWIFWNSPSDVTHMNLITAVRETRASDTCREPGLAESWAERNLSVI